MKGDIMKHIKKFLFLLTVMFCLFGMTACNGMDREAHEIKDDISEDVSEGVSEITKDRIYNDIDE